MNVGGQMRLLCKVAFLNKQDPQSLNKQDPQSEIPFWTSFYQHTSWFYSELGSDFLSNVAT